MRQQLGKFEPDEVVAGVQSCDLEVMSSIGGHDHEVGIRSKDEEVWELDVLPHVRDVIVDVCVEGHIGGLVEKVRHHVLAGTKHTTAFANMRTECSLGASAPHDRS
jgi:hypothetical protein